MRDNNLSKIDELVNCLDEHLECIISHNSNIDIKIRLKLGILIENIKEDISLYHFNELLKKYIDIFIRMGIKLKSKDFSYFTCTKKYMEYFFSCEKKCEKIYLKYPDLINKFKICLNKIVLKYEDKLDEELLIKTDDKVQTFPASDLDLIDDYFRDKKNYMINSLILKCNVKEIDDNILLQLNTMFPKYKYLNYKDKKEFCNLLIDFYYELNMFRVYKRYMFLLDDFNNEELILNVFEKYLNSFDDLYNKFTSNDINIEELNVFIEFIYNPYSRMFNDIKIIDKDNILKILINKYKDLDFSFNDKYLSDNLDDIINNFESIIKYISFCDN